MPICAMHAGEQVEKDDLRREMDQVWEIVQ